jgi:EF hand
MLRYVAIAGSAILLLLGGFFIWKGSAQGESDTGVPQARVEAASAEDSPATPGMPPSADARTREQRRFDRADRDNDGRITLEEMTWQRRRNYDRLDANHDGRLSFEEWASRTIQKFGEADGDHDSALNRTEFATTAPRPRRTASARNARCDCTNQRAAANSTRGERSAAR